MQRPALHMSNEPQTVPAQHDWSRFPHVSITHVPPLQVWPALHPPTAQQASPGKPHLVAHTPAVVQIRAPPHVKPAQQAAPLVPHPGASIASVPVATSTASPSTMLPSDAGESTPTTSLTPPSTNRMHTPPEHAPAPTKHEVPSGAGACVQPVGVHVSVVHASRSSHDPQVKPESGMVPGLQRFEMHAPTAPVGS